VDDEVEDTPETSSKTRAYGWLLCVGLALALYALSTGPLTIMLDRGIIGQGTAADKVIDIVYSPIFWAAVNTPLRKPLGLYWHCWTPKMIDSKGQLNIQR
jgi:hypothetical protein